MRVFFANVNIKILLRRSYIISIARTKNVVTKGRSKVSQGQCKKIATNKARVDKKNSNQYKRVDFLFTSISKLLPKIRHSI